LPYLLLEQEQAFAEHREVSRQSPAFPTPDASLGSFAVVPFGDKALRLPNLLSFGELPFMFGPLFRQVMP